MNLKTGLLAFVSLVGAALSSAADPLYTVLLAPGRHFELVGAPPAGVQLSFYPLSEMMAQGSKAPHARKVVASDYLPAFATIRTDNPSLALQSLFNQIALQTGLMLRKHINTSLPAMAPATMMQAYSETAVITLLLVPKEPGLYLASGAYVIEERPEGSIDGTPEAIAQTKEQLRLLTADSTAPVLPASVVLAEIRPGDYFRGAQLFQLPDDKGGFYPAAVLILKRGTDYSLASYRNDDGQLTRLGEPVAWSGTKPPYVSASSGQSPGSPGNPPRLTQVRTGFRAENPDGKGGVDISFAAGAGHPILTPY
jgi:hypothetical protein